MENNYNGQFICQKFIDEMLLL